MRPPAQPETVELMTRNHLAAPLYPLRFGDDVIEREGYGLGAGVMWNRPLRAWQGLKAPTNWAVAEAPTSGSIPSRSSPPCSWCNSSRVPSGVSAWSLGRSFAKR